MGVDAMLWVRVASTIVAVVFWTGLTFAVVGLTGSTTVNGDPSTSSGISLLLNGSTFVGSEAPSTRYGISSFFALESELGFGRLGDERLPKQEQRLKPIVVIEELDGVVLTVLWCAEFVGGVVEVEFPMDEGWFWIEGELFVGKFFAGKLFVGELIKS
jgi:hypothetical protein